VKVPAILNTEFGLGLALVAGGGLLLYLLFKNNNGSTNPLATFAQNLTKGAVQTGGGALEGAIQGLDNNPVTNPNNQPANSGNNTAPGVPGVTGFGGDTYYQYSGFGGLSTPAATANQLSGGLFADIGEHIGSTLADWFGPAPTAQAPQQPINFGSSNIGGF
jgi:hypothetical protein